MNIKADAKRLTGQWSLTLSGDEWVIPDLIHSMEEHMSPGIMYLASTGRDADGVKFMNLLTAREGQSIKHRLKSAPEAGSALDNLQKAHYYDEAHTTLDVLGVPRKDEYGGVLNVSERIDLIRVFVPDLENKIVNARTQQQQRSQRVRDPRIQEHTWVRVPLIGANNHKFTAQAYVTGIDDDGFITVRIGGNELTFSIRDVTHEPIENVYPS